jgi:hypothetical protein
MTAAQGRVWRALARRVGGALLLPAALAACSPTPSAILLQFSEREADGRPFETRMVVTEAFLRIDGGTGADGFLLLDRAKRVIYSVSDADKTVLVIESLPVRIKPPAKFEHGIQTDTQKFPPIGGRPVRHHILTTNGQKCFEVFAAEGLMPQAVAALREFHQILAGEHAVTSAAMPADLRTDCDLADEVFEPTRYLAHGFPVLQRDGVGRVRELTNYEEDAKADAGLFEPPADYRRIRITEMRGGK